MSKCMNVRAVCVRVCARNICTWVKLAEIQMGKATSSSDSESEVADECGKSHPRHWWYSMQVSRSGGSDNKRQLAVWLSNRKLELLGAVVLILLYICYWMQLFRTIRIGSIDISHEAANLKWLLWQEDEDSPGFVEGCHSNPQLPPRMWLFLEIKIGAYYWLGELVIRGWEFSFPLNLVGRIPSINKWRVSLLLSRQVKLHWVIVRNERHEDT